GWSVREPFGRWSESMHALIVFGLRADEIRDSVLRIKLLPFTSPGKLDVQHVQVSLNGKTVATWQLSNQEMQEFSIDLPRGALSEKNVISFEMPDVVSPKSIGAIANETRRLGINVEWIEIDAR
ncbi:MAG TPA: hypothetical protein VK619_03080, partial [Pyrinomonadaceae bacterium]|nr:hypothetical protein [Pyrinomonadaceae bacterium]